MFKVIKFNIGQHFACALEYGDCPEMDDKEFQEFEEWLNNEQDGKTGHWSIDEISEHYGKCEVTGLISNLMQVSWNYRD